MSNSQAKRVRICEGYEGAFFPDLRYVQQGQKVFVVEGQATPAGKLLTESCQGDGRVLVESIDKLDLLERENGKKYVKDGKWMVEGPFQRSDVKNANGRTYPRKVWERLIANKSAVMEAMRKRAMLGLFEHPENGRTYGPLGALLVTDLKLNEDGVVWGKAELLDTPHGLILQEYTLKNIRWGVSSRGIGSVNAEGTVSESDFLVETWDAVMRPSTPGAYPTLIGNKMPEAVKVSGEMSEEVKALVESATDANATVVATLTETEQHAFASSLVTRFKQVNDFEAEALIDAQEAKNVRGWLQRKLSESIELLKPKAPAKTFTPVIETLQRQVDISVQENVGLRERLSDADAKLVEATDTVSMLQDKLAAEVEENAKMAARLEAATDVIAKQSKRKTESPLKAAVEEAVKEMPDLAPHRLKLEEATSLVELNATIRDLTKVVHAQVPVAEAQTNAIAPPKKRRSLPTGLSVVSESISENQDKIVAEGGVALAAKIIKRSTLK